MYVFYYVAKPVCMYVFSRPPNLYICFFMLPNLYACFFMFPNLCVCFVQVSKPVCMFCPCDQTCMYVLSMFPNLYVCFVKVAKPVCIFFHVAKPVCMFSMLPNQGGHTILENKFPDFPLIFPYHNSR